MNTEVRSATSRDFESIQALEAPLAWRRGKIPQAGFIAHAFTAEELAAFHRYCTVKVAVTEDGIAGMLIYGRSDSKPFQYLQDAWPTIDWKGPVPEVGSSIWLERLVVSEAHQKQGIGTMLMDTLGENEVSGTILTAVVTKPHMNMPALQFYTQQGFIQIGTYEADDFRALSPYESVILKREMR